MALTAEMQEAIDSLKGTHVKFEAEVRKMIDKDLDPLRKTTSTVEALQKRMDENQKALDDVIAKANRAPSPSNEEKKFRKKQKKALLNAYLKHVMLNGKSEVDASDGVVEKFMAKIDDQSKAYLQKGHPGFRKDDPEFSKKAMALGVDILGGYLAPSQFVNQIIQSEVVISPVREYASNFTTSNAAVELPIRTQRAGVTKHIENVTNNENQNIQVGLTKVVLKMYISIQVLPLELLQDAAFNLEELLTQNLSIEFAASQGTDFILGNNKDAPEGILTNPNIAVIPTATSSTFVAADVFSLMYGIKEAYALNGTFMSNRTTTGYIRKMVSSTGQFLWMPGLDGSQSAYLAGRPIREAPDMTAVTPTSNQKILLFGDFKRGYGIVDRAGMTMLRDPYSVSSSAQIKYVFTMRTGGAVLDTQALGILKVA